MNRTQEVAEQLVKLAAELRTIGETDDGMIDYDDVADRLEICSARLTEDFSEEQ